MVGVSHLFLLTHFYAFVQGQINAVLYELYSENERNGNSIFTFNSSSAITCVAICDRTNGCLSVNFHEDNETCVLTDYFPIDETQSGVPESGWKIYFRRHFDVNLLEGATAWQLSTYLGEKADNAIDNNTETGSHTNGGSSYWAVEFGTAGPVAEVKLSFRKRCCYYYRNTNYTLTVSNSRDDVINDGGKFCGEYFGAAIDKEPFELVIKCTNTIYGRFLKIKHEMKADALILAEVEIRAP